MRLQVIFAAVVGVAASQVGCSPKGEDLPGIAKESTPRAIVRDSSARPSDARLQELTIRAADSANRTAPRR